MIRKSREKRLRSKSRVKSASKGNHNYQQFAFWFHLSEPRRWSKHARDGEKVDRIAAKMELNRLDFQFANLMPQRKRNLDHLGKNWKFKAENKKAFLKYHSMFVMCTKFPTARAPRVINLSSEKKSPLKSDNEKCIREASEQHHSRRGNSLIYFLPSIVLVLWLFMQHRMKKVLVCRTKQKRLKVSLRIELRC